MRPLLLTALLPLDWFGMLVFHECGHMIAAVLTGGVVRAITLPLFDFSRTEVFPNPHPLVVAWAGPFVGAGAPLLLYLMLRKHLSQTAREAVGLFVGFCLVANGAYIGAGWTLPGGDAADIVRHGSPVCLLVLFGCIATGMGLLLWHKDIPTSRRDSKLRPAREPSSRTDNLTAQPLRRAAQLRKSDR